MSKINEVLKKLNEKLENVSDFIQNSLSSGMIANKTNIKDYKRIDQIKQKAFEISQENKNYDLDMCIKKAVEELGFNKEFNEGKYEGFPVSSKIPFKMSKESFMNLQKRDVEDLVNELYNPIKDVVENEIKNRIHEAIRDVGWNIKDNKTIGSGSSFGSTVDKGFKVSVGFLIDDSVFKFNKNPNRVELTVHEF